jgi:predicted MFS family arabinose efflux permease
MTAGSILAAVPGGRLARRVGLRRALLISLAAVPLMGALRTLVRGETAILGSAFAAGLFFSLWVVCIAPTIAALVPARSRPRAFSIFFASSIALGVLGGAIGGRLPGLLDSSGPAAAWSPTQLAILAGCAISALALVPGVRLGGFSPEIADPAQRPSGPFIRRFLAAIFLWNLAIGAFNPFFNVYFSESLNLSVDRLGDLFAAGQLAQVGAVLLAPFVLARLGNVSAIAVLQGLAGVALALLATRQPLWLPAMAYLLYMSFQWMSEPGLHNLLMGQVGESERTTASSLNYLTAFSAHAIAAAAAGAAIARWDYATVLTAAAAIAVLAGCLFRGLLIRFENPQGMEARKAVPDR